MTAEPSCAACGAPLAGRSLFQFQAPGGAVVKCAPCALRHPPMLRRSLGIAAVVGTLLLAINQGDLLLRGAWPPALVWKVPLTYLVPFVVASWGALVNGRMRR